MRCTVKDENHSVIPCDLQQTDANTFSIKIKSTCMERRHLDEPEPESAPKRQRLDAQHPKRELRQQLKPAQPITSKRSKKSTALVRAKHPMAVLCERVDVNDVILCKMRGFCPWPALVTEINGNSVFVEFFGDHTTQKTTLANTYKFNDSSELILHNLLRLKNPLFARAVQEAELALRIPESVSIFGKMNRN